jgi:hypothetical protein
LDIIRRKGDHYVPKKGGGVKREESRVRGTNGTSVTPALNRRQRRQQNQLALYLRAQGWSAGLCQLAAYH